MENRRTFSKVKLFCGMIFSSAVSLETVTRDLEESLSPVDGRSRVFDFDQTDYYEKEMGAPLFRQFLSFRELIDAEALPDIKIMTHRMEKKYADGDRRRVNLDPGFLSNANVIIATTKNHYHRVPLQKGIYAHLEYVIQKKRPRPLEWTYPDFRTAGYINWFADLAEKYRNDVHG